jgi:predicted ATPase
MFLEKISISGLRGIAETQEILFAQPNKQLGSGLTILVGANNSGKSTIVEAIDFVRQRKTAPVFGENRRNAAVHGRIRIEYTLSDGGSAILGTNPAGGGQPRWTESLFTLQSEDIFVVPSRRGYIESGFQNTEADRARYLDSMTAGEVRGASRHSFGWRLTKMNNNRNEIDKILGRILGHVPEWTIEPAREGSTQQFNVRFYTGHGSHPAEGVGEGLLSLLFLADALYDSEPGHIIVIDEPELSLHPEPQRQLAKILAEYARDRQIIYATHSPYFADWSYIFNGAGICRVYRENGRTRLANLTRETVEEVSRIVGNFANPHVLGLDAREIFFLTDNVLLVEGQEDVVGYEIIASSLGLEFRGRFYGWGVGGAGNMSRLASVLSDLRFSKVVIVLDADQQTLARGLQQKYPNMAVLVSPKTDVRSKPARRAVKAKEGFLNEHWRLPPETEELARSFVHQVNEILLAGQP